MSRWIDAEWLLNFFEPYPNDYQTPLGLLRACVDDAPSIDIVRCKECVHGTWHEQTEMYICSANDQDLYEAEHFCSYGERREP